MKIQILKKKFGGACVKSPILKRKKKRNKGAGGFWGQS